MGLSLSQRKIELPDATDAEAKRFAIQPMINRHQLNSFLGGAKKMISLKDVVHEQFADALWLVFARSKILYVHEMLICLALVADGPYEKKCQLLFDLLKSMGNDKISYDEIIFGAFVCATAFCRLWNEDLWDERKQMELCEAIAHSAYSKTGKEVEEDLNKEEFVTWFRSRFQENRVINTSDELMRLYESPF